MYCPKCGAQIDDGVSFCPKCGAAQAQATPPAQAEPSQPTYAQHAPAPEQPLPQQQAYQQQTGPTPEQPAYQQQPSAQQATPQPSPSQGFKMPSLGELFCSHNEEAVRYAESTGLQMKWYKALTIALLYIGALLNLVTGLRYVTGNAYGGVTVYAFFPALHFVDFLYGLIYIVLALAMLYIRMRLAQFGSEAPRLYLTLLLANVILALVYSLVSSIILGSFDTLTLLGSVGVSLAMYTLNRTYFEKRQHLFTM